MNHEIDYDRNHNRENQLNESSLKDMLRLSLEQEEEMMRAYLITAERVHDNEALKVRLREFAEGNAKRSRQLIDELAQME